MDIQITQEYDLFEDGVSDSDRVKLEQARELIKDTIVWKEYASDDYDWNLWRAVNGINETLEGSWWV